MKIINPKNAGGHLVVDWCTMKKFNSLNVLKDELRQYFREYVEDYDFDIGYMSPGHGMKGKQHQFKCDEDIFNMYAEFEKRKHILLWIKCLMRQKRSATSDSDLAPPAKRSGSVYVSTIQKMHEVDIIVEELKKKHEGTYTPEQIRCWANMLQIKQHESYDSPPNKPFFKSKSKGGGSNAGVSPGRKVSLRSQCIQQLDKWHDLLVRGVISEEQYQEFKDTILSDMKSF